MDPHNRTTGEGGIESPVNGVPLMLCESVIAVGALLTALLYSYVREGILFCACEQKSDNIQPFINLKTLFTFYSCEKVEKKLFHNSQDQEHYCNRNDAFISSSSPSFHSFFFLTFMDSVCLHDLFLSSGIPDRRSHALPFAKITVPYTKG
jgi:hypothetical protein